MFKESFKYYKTKKNSPSYNKVLDFNNSTSLAENKVIRRVELNCSIENYGLKDPKDWEVFEICSIKGLIFIKNPFTAAGQRYWIKQCLKEYSKKPNKLNIDSFNIVRNNEDWWDKAQNNIKVLQSLRWATLGYHHNWDTKVYTEENKNVFPEDLKELTEYMARTLGFEGFVAEAAIVNYYHMDSTLSGHTDHSEKNLNAPLFSFSFGQTAIFLIGGKSIEEVPMAMFLRSGDVLIMSKYARLCYHGVPKIIKTDEEVWNKEEIHLQNNKHFVKQDLNWVPFNEYLKTSRININIRQVLNNGDNKL